MTQKERQERSREEIYRAALEEFGTCGYDRVNMERICGNHGISKGMMYHSCFVWKKHSPISMPMWKNI